MPRPVSATERQTNVPGRDSGFARAVVSVSSTGFASIVRRPPFGIIASQAFT